MSNRVDEQCRVELDKLLHFRELGLRPDLAVKAVGDGIDWQELKALLERGCRLELAIDSLR